MRVCRARGIPNPVGLEAPLPLLRWQVAVAESCVGESTPTEDRRRPRRRRRARW